MALPGFVVQANASLRKAFPAPNPQSAKRHASFIHETGKPTQMLANMMIGTLLPKLAIESLAGGIYALYPDHLVIGDRNGVGFV